MSWRRGNKGKGGAGPKDAGYRAAFGGSSSAPASAADREDAAGGIEERAKKLQGQDSFDASMGYERYFDGPEKVGWLMNLRGTTVADVDTKTEHAALDLYFLQQNGECFKVKKTFAPYFLLSTREGMERQVDELLRRRFEGQVLDIELVEMNDLELKNHLSGVSRTFLKMSFRTVTDLMDAKRQLLPVVEKNRQQQGAAQVYQDPFATNEQQAAVADYMDTIVDMREFDVPYVSRVAIDLGLRVGLWYQVHSVHGKVQLTARPDLESRPRPRILAYDIETSKAKLKFPDAEKDPITMISYMFDGEGFLIVNRAIVSEDIEDLEYTPKPEYPGTFHVFNEPNECEMLERFFSHIQELKPNVFVTYNGDNFDWPYVEKRARVYRKWMSQRIGMRCNEDTGECLGRAAIHLDCYYWVKRDSYLPQGSQGLKSVTRYKLGYNPVELDPEDMLPFAYSHPQVLAAYSVSDAVATYYLYMKYVHPFIFSLCNIIPMSPDDVLRKGSGTLCEFLLQVEAFNRQIVCPNKHGEEHHRTYKGHLLESETYIGGHVEALESGVFRSDIPADFDCKPEAYQHLIDKIDEDLKFAVEQDENAMQNMPLERIANYSDVRDELVDKLVALKEQPKRTEMPVIYHLDVGAMYPNIILTNRLQPPSMVSPATCAACDFNRPGNDCQRSMEWIWRGDYFPADRSAVRMISRQLESERIVVNNENDDGEEATSHVLFADLKPAKQASITKGRVKEYSRRIHKRVKDTAEELREAIVCQRENGFYVETVKAFRDRRYIYKAKTKSAFKKLTEIKKSGAGGTPEAQEAADMVVLYESLQLAHKCILNSFYGYVMRKGARWYSMEMAGVVTLTGARIIKGALDVVQHVGRALELDTDGIWCILPKSFPEDFTFVDVDGGKHVVSYPCVMLNADCDEHFKNPQYQDLTDPVNKTYEKSTQCSIFFEVDGPYKAMILPASQEEGKSIKKRYAVFEDDGSLAELKGFELKRRGELSIIKIFQSQIFNTNSCFLLGGTLTECYEEVANVANQYLDILYSQGEDVDDDELIAMLTERTTMSKTLEEYGNRKSQAVTTALRLAEFLGPEMIGGASLACDFMISQKPFGSKITERAIPVIIFKEEPAVRHHYLKKWLKDNTISADIDVREIIDWKYYITRLNSTIQKIVTIPAALQGLPNPVPRVAHPDWLEKKVRERDSGMRQQKLSSFFTKQQGAAPPPGELMDLEDIGSTKSVPEPRKQPMIRQFFKSSGIEVLHDYEDRERGGRDDDGMEHADIDADFRRWVKTSKPKWKNILAERQQRRQAGIAPRERQSSASSVSNYFMRQSVVASRESWQIIHIVQDAPSTFMAWALVGGSNLQRLRIQIPRVVYVNSFDEQPALADCKVRRVLPRSRPCLNLYREVLPEKREAELQMMMSDPAVEGVYEAQTPQIFKAAMKLGGVCSLAAHARPDSSGAFTLEQIETSAQSVYLQPENIRLHRVWMYHSHSGKDRAVLGLFDAEARSAFLYVVSRQAGRVERVNTQRILRELQMPEDFSCNLTYASVLSVAQNGMQRELARLQKDRTAATVLILQSPLTLAVHLQTIRALGDMPVVCMPANLHDNDYPALGWETPIVRKMIRRSLAVDEWWNYQVELARFAHIPIGNVEPDSISFITDVSYARHLSAQNYCLWCSSAALPDLGGNEEEGGITEMDDSVKNCEGAYRTICVELDLFGLAVNTVLNSDLVDDIEGASHVFDEAACTDVDDAAATMPAFAVLKTMVDRWHKQAQAGSMWANELLMNFYRWLRSPTSKLYDPRLFRTVHNMIYKVFLQLMGEFRSLGATIVSACFNKVILCTGKDNIETAKQYLDYLLDTIATSDKQLFSKVRFIRRAWWRCLLYKDRANYGGIRLNVPDDDLGIDDQSNSQHAYATADPMDETTNDENAASRMNIEADAEVDAHTSAEMDTDDVATTNSEVANDDFHDKVEINFNVAKYLPKDLQLYFDRIVAEFILVPVKEARALQAEQLNNPQSTQHNYESIAISLGEVVRTTMTRTLCRMVDAIDKKYDGAAGAEKADAEEESSGKRRPPGAGQGSSRRVALEFVKTVSHVLSLDGEAQKEVGSMRRTLLRLLKVKEFAAESQFKNPCRGFTLPDVICANCNFSRDLDLLRDPDVVELDADQQWLCPECFSPYSKAAIEAELVAYLQRRTIGHSLTDLVCAKCHTVKGASDNLAPRCACSGEFKPRDGQSDFQELVRSFTHLSRYHSFEWLEETAEWLQSAYGN